MTKEQKFKSFPIVVSAEWLDRLGKAVNLSDIDTKYEFIIRATEEKMEKVERESVKK